MHSQKTRRHTDTSTRTNTQRPVQASRKNASSPAQRSPSASSQEPTSCIGVIEHLLGALGAVAGCTLRLEAQDDVITLRMVAAPEAGVPEPAQQTHSAKAPRSTPPEPRLLRYRLSMDQELRCSFKRAAKRARATPSEVMRQMMRDYVAQEAVSRELAGGVHEMQSSKL